MDTNNLRYFAAVAKYGSITQAAKAAYISQPQLSHIIRQLEKKWGLPSFAEPATGQNSLSTVSASSSTVRSSSRKWTASRIW